MRIGFVTCVQLGMSCMEAIYAVGGKLDFAMTLRDDLAIAKSGRIYLDEFCRTHSVALSKIRNINDDDAVVQIVAANLDWLFIVGWSQIARSSVLASPRRGVLGMHPTLLPIGRGRAAIPWAILHGLTETGVSLFKLDEGVDTGPIVAQVRVPIAGDETSTTLYAKVNDAHVELIKKNWRALTEDELQLQPQDNLRATVWTARTPADGLLIQSMVLADAERLVRAATRPYPGAFIDDGENRIRIWKAIAHRGIEAPTMVDVNVSRPMIAFSGGVLELVDWNVEKLPSR